MIGAFIFIFLMSYLIPFAMISLFVSGVKFYLGEQSLGLYSPAVYCISMVLLEMCVLIPVSVAASAIMIPMVGVWNDVVDNWVTFSTILAILMASSLTGSAAVLFFSALFPSQDLVFVYCSTVVCTFLSIYGDFIPFPKI